MPTVTCYGQMTKGTELLGSEPVGGSCQLVGAVPLFDKAVSKQPHVPKRASNAQAMPDGALLGLTLRNSCMKASISGVAVCEWWITTATPKQASAGASLACSQ
jgi:hypothetical protein